jgi:DNA-binding NarL/FixJ family response regulator
MPPVSPRERATLRLVIKGWTNDEIGSRLGISESTVKAHVSSLLRKFRAANRAELAAKAVHLRWESDE